MAGVFMANEAMFLYRKILKTHKVTLPPSMRIVANEFVRKEFQLHKKATPVQVREFMNQWRYYVVKLQLSPELKGEDIEPSVFEKLAPEQKLQLESLKNHSQQLFKQPEEEGKAN